MELCIDSLKEAITDNPGINYKGLMVHFNTVRSTVLYWINKLINRRQEFGNKSWLFKQMNHGRSRFFSRVYAEANNTPSRISAPPTDWGQYKKMGVKKESKGVSELSKVWLAPKGALV